jgi:hypothetical protein
LPTTTLRVVRSPDRGGFLAVAVNCRCQVPTDGIADLRRRRSFRQAAIR